MSKVYYITQKGDLIKSDNTIEFVGKDGENRSIPIYQVQDMFVNSGTNITSECLSLISKNSIGIHYFNNYEYYIGSFIPKHASPHCGDVLINQAMCYSDVEKRNAFAKKIINASIINMRKMIRYYAKKNNNLSLASLEKYNDALLKLENAKNINEIMLVEAFIHKKHYANISEILNNNYGFVKREKKSAKDVINALYSFVNSLLYAIILSEVQKTSLSPYISFLHEPGKYRYSLTFDIAEIFRPLITEKLIIKLINKNIITENDFDKEKFKLTENAVKKIFYHFDEKITTTIYHRQLKRNVSYRTLIGDELRKLKRAIEGQEEYKPFLMWW